MNNPIIEQLKKLNKSLTNVDIPTAFCEHCKKRVAYLTTDKEFVINDRDIKYQYKGKIANCKECGEEVYPNELNEENIKNGNEAYRKAIGIITISQIDELLNKYNIGATVLSELLNWSKVTIQRYKDDRMPTKKYSDILLKLLNNPNNMRELVENNKEKMTPVAYKKVKSALDSLNEMSIDIDKKDKLYLVTDYILHYDYEFTNKAIQKLLYFIQGFSIAFNNEPIFNNLPEAWVHGPVYREIYNKYKHYGYNPIEKTNILNPILEKQEEILIDNVIKYLGGFTANKLEEITHEELPWLKARAGLKSDENSNKEISFQDICHYYTEIKSKYCMITYKDIQSYAKDQI